MHSSERRRLHGRVATARDALRPVAHPTPPRLCPAVDAAAAPALELHRRLARAITEYAARLDDGHEVGVRLEIAGLPVVFRLEAVACDGPARIAFSGSTAEGDRLRLTRPARRVSLRLTRLPRRDPDAPKRAIRFTEGRHDVAV